MLYLLTRSADGGVEEPLGIFTAPGWLAIWVSENPPADGFAYSILTGQENSPGIWRRDDIALVPEHPELELGLPPQLGSLETVNPIVGPADVQIMQPGSTPFDIRFVRSTDGKEMLRLFETSDGILDAQFVPTQLTEAATIAVRELMRVFKEAEWRQS